MILGAAIIDIALILSRDAAAQFRATGPATRPQRRLEARQLRARLVAVGRVLGCAASSSTGTLVLHQPVGFLVFAVALVFVFVMVNGISLGIIDQNPISSAFVVTVILMAALGLKDPVRRPDGGDRAARRPRSDRLRHAAGPLDRLAARHQPHDPVPLPGRSASSMGAMMAVVFAKLFMSAYPVLTARPDRRIPAVEQPARWASAMTYKFVGVLRSLTDDKPYQRTAIWIGVAIGFVTEVLRKLIKSRAAYRRFVAAPAADSPPTSCSTPSLLPSPYASSFGGFVNLPTSAWFAAGGVWQAPLNSMPAQGRAPPRSPRT